MIYRVLAGILLYVALPFGWVSLGPLMLLAPARFTGFIDENVVALPRVRQALVVKLAIRAVGAGLIAFAVRFVLKLVAFFR